MTLDYRSANGVCLTVDDKGAGAALDADLDGGFGLLGLRERAQLLGGRVRVQTVPGAGFTLKVEGAGMNAIRLLLVDDQSLFREGIKTLLSVQPGIDVVGEAANGEEALRRAKALEPHVILMDLRMPVMNGVESTRRIREQLPRCQVIVLTTFDDDEEVFEALRAGAVGYLLKDASLEKLLEAIRAAARGESFLQPSIAAKVVAEFSRLSQARPMKTTSLVEPLSDREREGAEIPR